jgi:hypothetical protein
MRIHPRSLLDFRLFLFVLSLFSLIWMVMKELSYSRTYGQEFSISGGFPLYADQIFLSSLLVLASLGMILNHVWSHSVALLLGGLVLFECLGRRFLLLAKLAEVPRFSREHFALWWPNLNEGQLLQIILASIVMVYSLTSLIRLLRRRNLRTMSNKLFHLTPR